MKRCVIISVLPTCLLCVCLSGSVYCEDVSPDMSAVPTLPKETAYLYARFNKITKIHREDFADTGKTILIILKILWSILLLLSFYFHYLYFSATLRRIDLSGNLISEIEDGSFSKLPNLQELKLAENRLTKLPMLPSKLVTFNANFNRLKTQGVKANAFKVSWQVNA